MRCERLKREQAEEMLPSAHLPELIVDPPVDSITPTTPVLYIPGQDLIETLNTLTWLVSYHLLEGLQAVLYHCPAWAGHGWDFVNLDHLSPTMVAYAFPDAIQASREYRDALAQAIHGRIMDDRRVAVATIGEWEPQSTVEALLVAELRRWRSEDAAEPRRDEESAGLGEKTGA